jgi:hypothetical protein
VQARKVLARLLPEEEIMGLRNLFREMDANGDGVLTLLELQDAISTKGLSLPDAQAKSLLAGIDLNVNGVVDYEEFLAATVHQNRLDKDELLLKVGGDDGGIINEGVRVLRCGGAVLWLRCAALCCAALRCAVLYCAVMYCDVLCC